MTSLYTYFRFLHTGRDRNYTTDLNMTSSYMYFSFPRTGWDRNYTTDLNTTSLYTYFQPKQNSKTQKHTKKFEHNKPLRVLPQNIQKRPLSATIHISLPSASCKLQPPITSLRGSNQISLFKIVLNQIIAIKARSRAAQKG